MYFKTLHNYALIMLERWNIMPQIIPIKDLRDTNKISELCSNLMNQFL